MEIEIIKKWNSEGLREVRVTWYAWTKKEQEAAEPIALNLTGSWSCKDYFPKEERKMIKHAIHKLVLPEQYHNSETILKGKERKLKIYRKMDTE